MFYAVNKPLGLTSHGVVSRARRLLGTRRVGHSGTLDPLAGGVLVLAANGSTKALQFLERDSKDYLAWVCFGAATPTLDAEGPLSETAPEAEVAARLSEAALRGALPGFLGEQQQVPPQYSAVQLGGQRAYAVARAGGELALPARPVTLHELDLLGLYPSLAAAPRHFAPDGERYRPDTQGHPAALPPPLGEFPVALLWARVGSGTYLRSLARDLGAALGLPAHLGGLLRTRVGRFTLEGSVPLDALPHAPGLAPEAALPYPRLHADDALARDLLHGKRPASGARGRVTVLHGGRLLAVAEGDGEHLRVLRAWA